MRNRSRRNQHARGDKKQKQGSGCTFTLTVALACAERVRRRAQRDGSAMRQVVDDYLAMPHGVQFTRATQQTELAQSGPDPSVPSR